MTPDLSALQRAEEEALAYLLRDLEEEPARMAALVATLERQEEENLRALMADVEQEPARIRALLAELEREGSP